MSEHQPYIDSRPVLFQISSHLNQAFGPLKNRWHVLRSQTKDKEKAFQICICPSENPQMILRLVHWFKKGDPKIGKVEFLSEKKGLGLLCISF